MWKFPRYNPRMTTRPLIANHLRFISEYLAVLPRNATAAYQRVYPDVTYEAATACAARLMADPRIKAEIERREAELCADLALQAKDVIREIALVSTADPRELSEYYRGACRHCWGIDFKYQRRPSEYEADYAAYLKQNAALVKEGKAEPDPLGIHFPILGGVGFSTRKPPNPECPECDGVGVGYEYFKDTRDLSPGAARLFDGVKRTKDGVEIKTRDRSKALDLAAQHLGIAKRAVELTGKGGGPVQSETAVSLKNVDPTTAAQVYQSIIGGG